MAFGDGEEQGTVNAGAAAQPLVTSADPSVIGPQAVQDLVSAYRNGFVTTQDILDHVGTVGQAKKKALLESLGEYVNPDVIQSRLAQAKAATAQSQLAQSQAQAGQGLVQPQAQAAAAQANLQAGQSQAAQSLLPTQTAAAQSDASRDQENVSAFKQFNKTIYKDDGVTPDFQKMAAQGQDYVSAFNKLQYAQKGLAVGQMLPQVDPKTGQKSVTVLDGFGQPRTPQSVKMYSDMRDAAFQEVYARRQGLTVPGDTGLVTPAGSPAPQAPAPGSPSVSSQPTVSAPAPAAAAGTGLVTSASAPAQSDIQQASIGQGYEPGYFGTPEEISKALTVQKSYELFQQQKGYANSFDTIAQQISAIPPAEQKTMGARMNTLDASLMESLIKMYDPQGTIREFKWDKLGEDAPLAERLNNFRAEIAKTGHLTPGSRERLMQLGYETVNAKEGAIRSDLGLAAYRAKAAGVDEQKVLGPDEMRILKGIPFSPGTSNANGATPAPAAKAATATPPAWAPPGTQLQTIKGKPAWTAPDGRYWFQ